MSTLYIDRKDMELRHEGGHVRVYCAGELSTTVPVRLIDRVVLRGRATVSTGALGLLAENGVGLLILSGRNSRFMCCMLGRPHADADRRLGQYRAYCDDDFRLKFSRTLLLVKLRGQIRGLRMALDQRPDQRKRLRDGIGTVEGCFARLKNESLRLAQLLGLEGAAAAAYFPAFSSVFPPSLNFTSRNRRPPRDPVNACLSLTYTLLHFEAVTAAFAVGLDPYIGLFHEPAHGRESLASDLIEPIRPRADAWVWELFKTRQLRAENFAEDKGACLLNKAGRQAFYASYEAFSLPVRRLLRRYAGGLARRLREFAP